MYVCVYVDDDDDDGGGGGGGGVCMYVCMYGGRCVGAPHGIAGRERCAQG